MTINSPAQSKDYLHELIDELPEAEIHTALRFLEFLVGAGKNAFEPEKKKPLTARALLESGLVGIWKDRTDIGDSSEFAEKLRERVQHRQRG